MSPDPGWALAAVLDLGAHPIFVQALVEVQALQDELEDGGDDRRRRLRLDLLDVAAEALHLLDDALVIGRGHHVADLDGDAGLEARDHVVEVGDAEVAVEDGEHGALDQLVEDLLLLAVLHRLELNLARYGGGEGGGGGDGGGAPP